MTNDDDEFPDDPLLLQQKFKDQAWGGKRLRPISLFAYLSDKELEELYQIGKIVIHNAKTNIVIESEPTRGLYVLLHGLVSVYKRDTVNNNLIRLAFLEHGAVFGELSLFDDAPRSATVVTETQSSLFHLDQQLFQLFLEEKGASLQARFYKKCAEEMASRFRKQNSDYVVSQHLLWKYALRKSDDKKAEAEK
jgi:CRP-like cAMP-binding protein